MLKLNPNPTFCADVRISVPGEETPATIRMEFRHNTMDAMKAWWDGNENRPVAEALDDLIVSWDSVTDDQGAQVGYSKLLLANLLANYPAASSEIVSAYLRELTASRVKN